MCTVDAKGSRAEWRQKKSEEMETRGSNKRLSVFTMTLYVKTCVVCCCFFPSSSSSGCFFRYRMVVSFSPFFSLILVNFVVVSVCCLRRFFSHHKCGCMRVWMPYKIHMFWVWECVFFFLHHLGCFFRSVLVCFHAKMYSIPSINLFASLSTGLSFIRIKAHTHTAGDKSHFKCERMKGRAQKSCPHTHTHKCHEDKVEMNFFFLYQYSYVWHVQKKNTWKKPSNCANKHSMHVTHVKWQTIPISSLHSFTLISSRMKIPPSSLPFHAYLFFCCCCCSCSRVGFFCRWHMFLTEFRCLSPLLLIFFVRKP